ncbi:MAG: hypothetical protein IV094_24240 [Vitreoscilla sp.]|nr:hypothetical protein [Vitreoscilla sp.]
MLAIALGVRARLLLARGANDEAHQAAERGIELMKQAGTPRDLIALDLEQTLAAVGLARGEADAELARLRLAVPAEQPPGVTLFAPQVGMRLLAGEAALRSGDGAGAATQFAAVWADLQANGEAELHGEWLAAAALGLGRAHRLNREHAKALPELQSAERLLAHWHAAGSLDLAEARLALAEGLLDLNDKPAARALWARAQQAIASQGRVAARYREALQAVQARLAG